MMSEITKIEREEENSRLVDGTEGTPSNECDIEQMVLLLNHLRDDEVEVLWDLLSDIPLKAIAAKRNISKRTVQFRKKRLLELFKCRSLLELAAYFASRGVTGDFSRGFFCRFRSMRRARDFGYSIIPNEEISGSSTTNFDPD
jgi:DNA-binding CsgD family transcriptional regulator